MQAIPLNLDFVLLLLHYSKLACYRPFSLLSIFNKLLEKLMFNRLVGFLHKRHLIYNKQFGFRTHHSTDHVVLSITDQVLKAIEDHDYSSEYSWTSAKHLILLITTFCSQNLNTMVLEALLRTTV